MSNLIFCLNATMPLFLMMVVGYILKKINFIDDKSASVMNKLVFKVFLPALLFTQLSSENFEEIWDGEMILFCFVVTVVSIVLAVLLSLTSKDKADRGEMVQAAFRSAAATLGIAFILNIYDTATAVALMIIGSVPMYNIFAVLILSVTAKNEESDKKKLYKQTFINVITNPIILSIVAGLLWSVLKLPMPVILDKSLGYLAAVASPLALIVLGASFEFKDAREKLWQTVLVSSAKLLLWSAIFLPVAVHMGYRDEKLVAILIMLGSGTTSSSFIMAKNMGHKGVISSSAVMVTTLLSSFTLAMWLFILKSMGYI